MNERKVSNNSDFNYSLLVDAESKNNNPKEIIKHDFRTPWMPGDSRENFTEETKDYSLANCYWDMFSASKYPYDDRSRASRYQLITSYYASMPVKKLIVETYMRTGYINSESSQCTKNSCCFCNVCITLLCGLPALCGIILPSCLISCCIGATADIINKCEPISPEDQSMDFDKFKAATDCINKIDPRGFLNIFFSDAAIRDEIVTRTNVKLSYLVYVIATTDQKDISMHDKKQALAYFNERGMSILGSITHNNLKECVTVKKLIERHQPEDLELLDFILTEGKAKHLLLKKEKRAIGDFFSEIYFAKKFDDEKVTNKLTTILKNHDMTTKFSCGPLYKAYLNETLYQLSYFGGVPKIVFDYVEDNSPEQKAEAKMFA